MARLIDADALITEIEETPLTMSLFANSRDCYTARTTKSMILGIVKDAPTLSPDEVRGVGKWERAEYEDNKFWANYCSLCYSYLPYGLEWKPNYCPNCDAKM